MATHSSVLAWRIPGMGEPDGLPSMGSQSRTRLKRLSSSSTFTSDSDGKESACNVGDPGLIPGSGRFPWRWEWHPTPVFWPGESHGQRSLVGYSPWRHKEVDTTQQLTLALFTIAAAAAAKSLQSCPTLCDPRDGSAAGSPFPGILQARTLEWAAISFSNAGK